MDRLRLTGYAEIDKVLRGLPLQVNHRVLQNAHASAARVLVNAEKLTAPEGPTGRLVDSIGVVRIPFRRSSELGEVHVGPRRKGVYGAGGRVAHLVEYGTTQRYLKGNGKYRKGTNRGRMIPKPFARPSWERTKDRVISLIAQELGRHVLRYMRRTIKKHG